MEQKDIDRRNELYRKPGLTMEESADFTRLDDAFWVANVGVGMLRFVVLNHMRVEVTVVDDALKITFDDHYDDGTSHAILSPEHMDKVVEFYKAVRKG